MTEYYIASNSTDEKIIGKKYPQCKGIPSQMELTSNWFDQPNSMTNLSNDEFPHFKPELIFELEEKAKLTDIISPSNISAKGFLINEKVKDIFDKFILADHRYYPATLIVNDLKHQYYWLHFVKKDLDNINLNQSIFYKSIFGFDKGEYVKINSYQDALQVIRQEDCFIMPEKIVLNTNNNKTEQVFYLPIPNRIIVSKEVMNLLCESKIKGIDFDLIN
jgi:hypothetical protein